MKVRMTILAVALAASACGGKDVTSGTVINRDHQAAYQTYNSQCVAYNKDGLCKQSVLVPQYWPAKWSLELRDDSQDKPEKDRDTSWIEVTEAEWG